MHDRSSGKSCVLKKRSGHFCQSSTRKIDPVGKPSNIKKDLHTESEEEKTKTEEKLLDTKSSSALDNSKLEEVTV